MATTAAPPAGATQAAKALLLERLVHQVRVSSRNLSYSPAAGEEGVHAAGLQVLESLATSGTQTVPQLARRWASSRQNLQIIMNRLERGGLVEPVPNPAHKRSDLYRLTEAGSREAGRLSTNSSNLLNYLALRFSEAELLTACAVLERLADSVREHRDEVQEVEVATPPADAPTPGPPATAPAPVPEPPAEEMPVNLL